MTYQDRYGRYHDKPCIDGEPSSNNGWIYTAYANKLRLPLDQTKLALCYNQCSAGKLIRSPGQDFPPQSRDEVLGMAALGFLRSPHMNGWNFSPFPLPRLNLITLAKQLCQIRGQHRNYFWQNNLGQIYHVAFSVPLTDRAFILKCWGETHTPRALFYRAIAFVDSLIGKDSGIRYLKYGKSKEAMLEEFPADHPFRNT
jgi:hypothetical protein